jgi:ComF family protein
VLSVYNTPTIRYVLVQRFFKNETLRRTGQVASTLTSGLLSILYPSLCEECGDPVAPNVPICSPCVVRIPCADPAELQAIIARLDDPVIESVFALWYFGRDSQVRRLQHQLKYGNRPEVGRWFGRSLGVSWKANGRPLPDVIAPIPLHPGRVVERGYNQSLLIAEGFSEITGTCIDETLLVRKRSTRSQTTLTRAARRRNVGGVFECSGNPQGRSVLILDDVLTTGATLNGAARPLLQGGALRVDVAAIGLATS